jgi:HlyD family type I secretion membrane fusion protein
MTSIIIVDDDAFIRQILSAYLQSASEFQIIGAADNGKVALDLVEQLNPEIVLIDTEMPVMDGLTATEIICQRFPETKVVLLSSHDREEYVNRAIEAGAAGYLYKNITAEELTQTIRLISKGYLQFAPGLANRISYSFTVNGSKTEVFSDPPNSSQKSRQQNFNFLPSIEPDDFIPPLDRLTRAGGLILFAFFGVAILLTSILKYKVTVKTAAVVRPVGEQRLIQTAIAGTIGTIKVRENEIVKAGEIIATLDDSQLHTKQIQLQKDIGQAIKQLKQSELQTNQIARQITASIKAKKSIVASGNANLSLSQRRYQEQQIITKAELQKAIAAAKLAQEELTRYQGLAGTGAVSRLQISIKEAALEEANAKVQQVRATLNPSIAEVTVAKEQTIRERAEAEEKLAALDRDKENLIEKKITIEQKLDRDRHELQQTKLDRQKAIVRAPINGIIQQFSLRNPNQFVSAGTTIAQVAPHDTPLVVKTSIASEDIGKVEKGQTAQLRVFACPYTDYGTLIGQISTIAPDISNQQANKTANRENGTYEVTIQPKYLSLIGSGGECKVQTGMSAIADIITKEETVLVFLLRKARLITDV